MGDLPLPASSGPGIFSRGAVTLPFSLAQSSAPQPSDNLALLGVLRQALADKSQPADSILRAVTDAARVLTGAHGTALAVRMDDAILCRARSGTMAPPLGAPLSADSGISGECLRTATIQVCQDTATDPRVDPDVCLNLGIRSIAAVPLREHGGILGILEAFSARAGSFEEEQVSSLRALAEIAETACERERRARAAMAAAASAATVPAVVAPAVKDEANTYNPDERSSKKLYWILGGIAASVLLVSMVGWLSWRHTAAEIAASGAVPQPVSVANTSSASQDSSVSLKPTPTITVRQSDHLRTKDLLRNAAEVRPAAAGTDPASPSENEPAVLQLKTTARTSIPAAVPAEPPPQVDMAATAPPEALVQTGSAPLPALGAKISQGIVEAKLIRKVDPAYPMQARVQGLTGSVTLDATIGEDGFVRTLKIIDGPSLLSSSAATAVRQWRYTPAVLNGKAIEAQKRITVVFKLP